ncbi:zinc ABC transporter substrate-binding protein, partial [Streptococcus sp. DD11]|uniref:metal ABC transporter solute-binding protein, Zn/Mn family n=1 Tax=Streptococcus sp. DD11 TaxID=1777879 RepID=UPI00100822B4
MKTNTRLIFFISLLAVLSCLLGCQSRKDSVQTRQESGLKIVTSFYPIYCMVREISGPLNDVRMIQSGSGIHSFEPSANDIAAIYDADVFVYHSRTLESWAGELNPSLQHSAVKVLEASEGMDLDRVAGLEAVEVKEGTDEKSLYDPHTWLDPEKAAEEAQLIANQLSDLDSRHRDIYQANARSLKEKAHQLTEKYQSVFQRCLQKTFVTQHTAFSYLAKRFGLTQLGIAGISPEQEPNPRQLSEIEDFIKDYKVRTIFVESTASPKLAQALVKATGVQLKQLNPL